MICNRIKVKEICCLLEINENFIVYYNDSNGKILPFIYDFCKIAEELNYDVLYDMQVYNGNCYILTINKKELEFRPKDKTINNGYFLTF